jgi:hypothetical protein
MGARLAELARRTRVRPCLRRLGARVRLREASRLRTHPLATRPCVPPAPLSRGLPASLSRGSAADDASDSGFFLVAWKDDAANEAKIKEETKATLRCYPFAEQHKAEGKTCFFSGEPATHMALFARAY